MGVSFCPGTTSTICLSVLPICGQFYCRSVNDIFVIYGLSFSVADIQWSHDDDVDDDGTDGTASDDVDDSDSGNDELAKVLLMSCFVIVSLFGFCFF